jgi:hypothetical protein
MLTLYIPFIGTHERICFLPLYGSSVSVLFQTQVITCFIGHSYVTGSEVDVMGLFVIIQTSDNHTVKAWHMPSCRAILIPQCSMKLLHVTVDCRNFLFSFFN